MHVLRTGSWTRSPAALVCAGLIAAALHAPAYASFHFVRITELFRGTDAHPNAHYVEMVAYSDFQNLFNGAQITVFDAAGNPLADFATFGANLPSMTTNQRSILVATTEARNILGITPDLVTTGTLPASGHVCFRKGVTVVDCVSYGSYTGSPTAGGSAAGTPAPGMRSGLALRRNLGANGTLEATDDTNSSIADFSHAGAEPKNFAGIGVSALSLEKSGADVVLNWTPVGSGSSFTIHETDSPATVRGATAAATVAVTSWTDPDPDLPDPLTCYVVKP